MRGLAQLIASRRTTGRRGRLRNRQLVCRTTFTPIKMETCTVGTRTANGTSARTASGRSLRRQIRGRNRQNREHGLPLARRGQNQRRLNLGHVLHLVRRKHRRRGGRTRVRHHSRSPGNPVSNRRRHQINRSRGRRQRSLQRGPRDPHRKRSRRSLRIRRFSRSRTILKRDRHRNLLDLLRGLHRLRLQDSIAMWMRETGRERHGQRRTIRLSRRRRIIRGSSRSHRGSRSNRSRRSPIRGILQGIIRTTKISGNDSNAAGIRGRASRDARI